MLSETQVNDLIGVAFFGIVWLTVIAYIFIWIPYKYE